MKFDSETYYFLHKFWKQRFFQMFCSVKIIKYFNFCVWNVGNKNAFLNHYIYSRNVSTLKQVFEITTHLGWTSYCLYAISNMTGHPWYSLHGLVNFKELTKFRRPPRMLTHIQSILNTIIPVTRNYFWTCGV